jgi:hypothetical protein
MPHINMSLRDLNNSNLQQYLPFSSLSDSEFNCLATGPVKTSPILEYYFQVFCKFHIFGSVHAM